MQTLSNQLQKPAGELIGFLPRAIKAALAPAEKWILQKEYNIEMTKKLLEKKLEGFPPEQIEAPEAHIAIPALQCINYCMDNSELQEMYANLLASAMCKIVKNGVHPGFVEIIRQLCPDEAKILRYMWENETVPTITVRYEDEKHSGINVLKDFSTVGEKTACENPYEQLNLYFDNLIRLGLLEKAAILSSLTDKEQYAPLKSHSYVSKFLDEETIASKQFTHYTINESYVKITSFGKKFCDICLRPPVITEIDQELTN